MSLRLRQQAQEMLRRKLTTGVSFLLAATASLFLAVSAFAQSPVATEPLAGFDAQVNTELARFKVPGDRGG